MKIFINHIILFTYCILITAFTRDFSLFSVTSVIALLASVIITNMSFFFHNKKFTASASGVYGAVSLFIPEFTFMLPALSYDTMQFSGYPFIIFFMFSKGLFFKTSIILNGFKFKLLLQLTLIENP